MNIKCLVLILAIALAGCTGSNRNNIYTEKPTCTQTAFINSTTATNTAMTIAINTANMANSFNPVDIIDTATTFNSTFANMTTIFNCQQ